MARDALLEEIRESLWSRIDRRLAVVLAISISGHLAVAIVAWLGDPPLDRPWLEPVSEYLYEPSDLTEEPIVLTPPADPVPGAGTPVTAAPTPAPAAHAAPRRHTNPSKLPTRPPSINVDALISGLVGDGPSFRDASRRSPGKDLDQLLTAARERGGKVKVGGDGTEETHGIGDGHNAIFDEPGGPVRTGKRPEAPPPRTIFEDPDPDVDYDPSDDIRKNRMRALQRCYQQELLTTPNLRGRVDLEFTVAMNGHVTAAHATGLAGVASCVARIARGWQFPVELPQRADFGMALIFVPN